MRFTGDIVLKMQPKRAVLCKWVGIVLCGCLFICGCILLGNPLDNAIEACQKMSDSIQKIISIKTKLVGNMLIMDIFNPVDHDVIILNNTIPTSKEETSNHGFGIYSLQRTLEKYDGIARFKCKNNIFVAEMSLIIS